VFTLRHEFHGGSIARPNVRVKPAPAVKRQARAADDDMHCSAGLAFLPLGLGLNEGLGHAHATLGWVAFFLVAIAH